MIPWWSGNAPVPIVAWICAVEVGEEPTLACSYHVPWGSTTSGRATRRATRTARRVPLHPR